MQGLFPTLTSNRSHTAIHLPSEALHIEKLSDNSVSRLFLLRDTRRIKKPGRNSLTTLPCPRATHPAGQTGPPTPTPLRETHGHPAVTSTAIRPACLATPPRFKNAATASARPFPFRPICDWLVSLSLYSFQEQKGSGMPPHTGYRKHPGCYPLAVPFTALSPPAHAQF